MDQTTRRMTKIVCVLMILTVGVLIGGRWYLVRKTGGAEQSREGLELTIAKLEADRRILSSRTAAIAESVQQDGKSTVDEVAALLADDDLNRLALCYLGADWSIPRGAFLGSLRDTQALHQMRKADREKRAAKVKDELEKIKRRQRILDKHIGAASDKVKREREKAELDRQVSELINSQTYRELVAADALATRNAQAEIEKTKTIAGLAADYRNASVVRLDVVLTEQLSEQRWKLSLHDKLTAALKRTDFWPLNALFRPYVPQ